MHVAGEGDDESEGDEQEGEEEEESSEAAEEGSEDDADMDEADISDDVDEEELPAAASGGEESRGRKRSAADAGISAGMLYSQVADHKLSKANSEFSLLTTKKLPLHLAVVTPFQARPRSCLLFPGNGFSAKNIPLLYCICALDSRALGG
jgi:hypothetical protein